MGSLTEIVPPTSGANVYTASNNVSKKRRCVVVVLCHGNIFNSFAGCIKAFHGFLADETN